MSDVGFAVVGFYVDYFARIIERHDVDDMYLHWLVVCLHIYSEGHSRCAPCEARTGADSSSLSTIVTAPL